MIGPDQPSGDERYGSDYYAREPGLDRMRRFSTHWWAARFYARLAAALLREAGGRRVLEIGCGHGHVLARLEDRFETWGIDISEWVTERARRIARRSRILRGDIDEELPAEIARGGFDLVLAKYVLEHLPRPEATIARIAGLLAPGGALLFSVPNTASPGRRLKGEGWFALADETHVSLLEPERWLDLARRAGLAVERTFSDGLWDVPYVRGVPRVLQYGIFSIPAIVTVALGRPLLPAGWGENLIVVTRRPEDQAPR